MSDTDSVFWPNSEVLPMRRFGMAYVLAPLSVGAVITFVAFLIAGMSEATTSGVISVTINAAITMIPAMLLFMLSFGAVGVVSMWYLGQRGVLSWAVCGALMGTLAALLVGEFLMDRVERPLLIASGLGGWAMFLLFRWFAGIRD